MELEINPTGLMYESFKNSSSKNFKLKIDIENGIIKQKDPKPLSFFKPELGWIESNEPEDHLDKIAISLRKSDSLQNILCFSYKDKTLAKRINPNEKNNDFIFSFFNGFIKCFPEELDEEKLYEYILKINKKYDLIILRHYLEHFDDPSKLLTCLSNCLKDKGQIYLEIPDCSRFIKEGIPLFLWEQHKSYFTKNSISKLIKSSGFKINNLSIEGENIEPSICIFTSKDKKIISYENNYDSKLLLKLQADINKYRLVWRNLLESNTNKKIILGIGHNLDRFLQITKTHDYFYSFLDNDTKKKGLFLANAKKPIECSLPINKSSKYIFIIGAHDRSKLSIAKKLKSDYPQSSFYSIFGLAEKINV